MHLDCFSFPELKQVVFPALLDSSLLPILLLRPLQQFSYIVTAEDEA